MKISKRVKILITVFVVIAITGVIGFLIIKQYQIFQKQNINSEQKSKEEQALLIEQQKELENTKQQIGSLEKSNQEAIQKIEGQQRTLENQQQANAEASKQKPIINNNQSSSNSYDLASIVAQWRPRIAHIQCEFRDNNGVPYLIQEGSGFVTWGTINNAQGNGGKVTGIMVSTNRHVITDQNIYFPSSCKIKFPDDDNIIFVPNDAQTFAVSDFGYDLGEIVIHQPDSYLKNSIGSNNLSYFLCPNKPAVGDPLIILGYPVIGSQNDITATEGIISGYDGNYYITSAKVEHGNSGGAAISTKDNCYIGIPSYVEVGSVEALARILDGNLSYK